MSKHKILIMCTLLTMCINLQAKTFYTSIEQSGTHLLKKLLTIATKGKPEFWLDGRNRQVKKFKKNPQGQLQHDRKLIESAPADAYIGGHIPYTREFAGLLREKNFKILLMVRDPQDQLISRADKIIRDPKHYPQSAKYPSPSDYPVLIRDLTHKLPRMYRSFLGWRKERSCLIVKFENLVGPQGGGTLQKQLEEIRAIVRHCGIEADEALIKECAENIYGGTETFHKGKIGRGKQVLTQQQKALLNKVAGPIRKDLGYLEKGGSRKTSPIRDEL